MSYFSHTMRRRLFAAAQQALNFSLVVDGAEYKPGDTVTILASTTVTVKGTGQVKVTLIGGGGAGGGSDPYNGDYSGGDGGDGGTSMFDTELTTGNYSVTIGYAGQYGVNLADGGTTTAFGHSAGGGYAGYFADEYSDGSDGSDGKGETSNGNDTAYGQGGQGDWYYGSAGTAGACIIKVVDPNAKSRTITLSGTFDNTYSYVVIGSTKYINAGNCEVEDGDVITLFIRQMSLQGSGRITIDGTTVVNATTTLQSYDYVVKTNCTITGTSGGSGFSKYYTLALVTT